MTYKSDTQPRCRYCGKPIRKETHTYWFGQGGNAGHSSDFITYRAEKPMSKAEAQRLVNQQIVSVRREKYPAPGEETFVSQVTTWDGESYADEFFCSGEHARYFAYAVLRAPAYENLAMPDYHTAKGH